jgi:hypothetical protein
MPLQDHSRVLGCKFAAKVVDATTQGKQERLNGFLSALLLAEVVGSMASSF